MELTGFIDRLVVQVNEGGRVDYVSEVWGLSVLKDGSAMN